MSVTIIAALAEEMIREWIVALERALASITYVYPTYSTASMRVAAHIRVSHQLLSGTSGRIVHGLARLMRG